MGCFSWLDCKTGEQIRIGSGQVFVLIPKEYGGGHIAESRYDGYGHFGIYDIYELIAVWNKPFLHEGMLESKPEKAMFGGFYPFQKEEMRANGLKEEEIDAAEDAEREKYYRNALRRRQNLISDMEKLKEAPFNPAEITYSDPDIITWLEIIKKAPFDRERIREIGIAIACYDEQNESLPFPIKITYDENAVYEDCRYSKEDPKQGCD